MQPERLDATSSIPTFNQTENKYFKSELRKVGVGGDGGHTAREKAHEFQRRRDIFLCRQQTIKEWECTTVLENAFVDLIQVLLVERR